ncbi:MAG: inosine/xanthosine triphosphatase [Candidatus Tritonobacter lacicola]|nr:inosine/xanthosine triphosphatase [Candidatus Tritonobacter lacicola]
MKIAVGSKNPVKIDAVKSVASKIFGEVDVEGVEVDSGVSHNPLSDTETIAGAVKRAKEARGNTGSDLGVGLEGGITEVDGQYYTCVWCAIDNGDEVMTGGGVHIPLPRKVLRMIVDEKMEMGHVMDRLTSVPDTKRRMGFEGILTKGLVNRRDSFELVLGFTFSKIISPELFD